MLREPRSKAIRPQSLRAVQHDPTRLAFFDSMDALLKVWHGKLLQLLYLAISLGWIGSAQWKAADEVVRAGLRVDSGGDLEKSSTQSERSEVRRLRLACKNTMHFGITLLMENTLRCVFKGVCSLIIPTRAWHWGVPSERQEHERRVAVVHRAVA